MYFRKHILQESIRLKNKYNLPNKVFVELYENLLLFETSKEEKYQIKYENDDVKNNFAKAIDNGTKNPNSVRIVSFVLGKLREQLKTEGVLEVNSNLFEEKKTEIEEIGKYIFGKYNGYIGDISNKTYDEILSLSKEYNKTNTDSTKEKPIVYIPQGGYQKEDIDENLKNGTGSLILEYPDDKYWVYTGNGYDKFSAELAHHCGRTSFGKAFHLRQFNGTKLKELLSLEISNDAHVILQIRSENNKYPNKDLFKYLKSLYVEKFKYVNPILLTTPDTMSFSEEFLTDDFFKDRITKEDKARLEQYNTDTASFRTDYPNVEVSFAIKKSDNLYLVSVNGKYYIYYNGKKIYNVPEGLYLEDSDLDPQYFINLGEYSDDDWIKAVNSDYKLFKYMPTKLQTENICLEVIQKDWSMIQYIHPEVILKHKEIGFIAFKQNPEAFRFIPYELRNREMSLIAVRDKGKNLQHVPENLRDEEICLIAVENNGFMLKYVPEKLRDKKMCLTAVRQDGFALMFVNPDIKDYEEIASEAVRQNVKVLPHLNIELQNKIKEKLRL